MKPQPLTLQEQADLLALIMSRCFIRKGVVGGETWMVITREDYNHLDAIRARLQRMAPHETRIRQVVTGKR